MHTLSRSEVREIDRRAIEDFGLPGIVLMENAGRGAAERIHAQAANGRVAILCGKGNNAGDGYVIARHLELLGHDVTILTACDPADLRGDAAIACEVARRSKIPMQLLADAPREAWDAALTESTVLVDALLGTGASGPPRGAIAVAIEVLNAYRARTPSVAVCAIDLPSGLDCDSGIAAGACVTADLTITFVAPKRGFTAPTAAAFLGRVEVVGIGAPACLLTGAVGLSWKYSQEL
jgi:NAD(P)H-hydrate epimerase